MRYLLFTKPAMGKTAVGWPMSMLKDVMEVMNGRRPMKPLQALVVEVGAVPLYQLLSQKGGGCHLLFVL